MPSFLNGATATAICALLLAGCELLGLPSGGSTSDVVAASADDPIEIEVGQTVVFEDLNARIRFVAVREDSRCPVNLDCFWQGRVRANFVLIYQGGAHPFAVEGYVGGTDEGTGLIVEVADLNITLAALAPYPVYDPDTGQSTRGRTATLLVTRN